MFFSGGKRKRSEIRKRLAFFAQESDSENLRARTRRARRGRKGGTRGKTWRKTKYLGIDRWSRSSQNLVPLEIGRRPEKEIYSPFA
jgi:hypothetical protein